MSAGGFQAPSKRKCSCGEQLIRIVTDDGSIFYACVVCDRGDWKAFAESRKDQDEEDGDPGDG